MLSPGLILTNHNIRNIQERAKQAGKTYEEQLASEMAETPLRRFGEPEDVAHALDFLLSTASRHINGANMILDGGLNRAY